MGLDNGIVIKPKTKKGTDFLENHFSENREKYYSEPTYEFAYFRKCWNIRRRFFDIYDELDSAIANNHDNEKDYSFEFAIEDIPVLVEKVFKYFLEEDNWEYDGICSQVFSWTEEIGSIAYAIRDLRFFYEDAVESEDGITDEDIEIYFYDSY